MHTYKFVEMRFDFFMVTNIITALHNFAGQ